MDNAEAFIVRMPVVGSILTPAGCVPSKEYVMVEGMPVAVTVNVPVVPETTLVLSELVMVGACVTFK